MWQGRLNFPNSPNLYDFFSNHRNDQVDKLCIHTHTHTQPIKCNTEKYGRDWSIPFFLSWLHKRTKQNKTKK